MTRSEALYLFGLPTDATSEQIDGVYQERFNNVQQQLRNSPTPFLQKKQEDNLKELEQAYQALTAVSAENLPSAKPIITQEAAIGAENGSNSMNASSDTEGSSSASPRLTKQLEGLKKQKTYFLMALIALASVLSYFVVQYFDLKGMKPKAEKYDVIEKKLLNRKFALKNQGKKAYEITAYHVTYLDDEGNLADMEEGMKGEKYSFIFEPDKTFTVTKVVGKNVIFDGKALSYTIILYEIGKTNADAKVFSGLFNAGSDTPLNPD